MRYHKFSNKTVFYTMAGGLTSTSSCIFCCCCCLTNQYICWCRLLCKLLDWKNYFQLLIILVSLHYARFSPLHQELEILHGNTTSTCTWFCRWCRFMGVYRYHTYCMTCSIAIDIKNHALFPEKAIHCLEPWIFATIRYYR